jgi:hypothetical protein
MAAAIPVRKREIFSPRSDCANGTRKFKLPPTPASYTAKPSGASKPRYSSSLSPLPQLNCEACPLAIAEVRQKGLAGSKTCAYLVKASCAATLFLKLIHTVRRFR